MMTEVTGAKDRFIHEKNIELRQRLIVILISTTVASGLGILVLLLIEAQKVAAYSLVNMIYALLINCCLQAVFYFFICKTSAVRVLCFFWAITMSMVVTTGIYYLGCIFSIMPLGYLVIIVAMGLILSLREIIVITSFAGIFHIFVISGDHFLNLYPHRQFWNMPDVELNTVLVLGTLALCLMMYFFTALIVGIISKITTRLKNEIIESRNQLHYSVERMIKFIGNVMRGDLSKRIIHSEKNDEIDALAVGINMMIDDISDGMQKLKLANIELAEKQQKLIATERLAAIGELSSAIAHELRNPLGSIKNAQFYIKKEIEVIEPEHCELIKFVNLMEREIDRCNKIITDLLNYSRNEHLSLTAVKIRCVIERVLSLIILPEHITIQTSIDDNIPAIEMDQDKMFLVLSNIVQNAIQAIGDNGEIKIIVKMDDKFLVIVITDDGPGITSPLINKIFDPLFTTKNTGTGLGLSICKKIIQAHGGRISADSTIGKGAQFKIDLPAKQAGISSAAATAGGGGA